MSLVATTLTNSSAGTLTTTNNSHDNNASTNDSKSVSAATTDSAQWGFSGSPASWKKFRFSANVADVNFGNLKVYIIPTGETDPANYTQVYNATPSETTDISYEHAATISADGIYVKMYNGGDTVRTVNIVDVWCWEEEAASGYPNDVGGVEAGDIDEIGGVATGDIDEVGGV